MYIKSIQIKNFRSFEDSEKIELGKINILVWKNNSWKSSIIKSIQQIQSGENFTHDVRHNANHAITTIELEDILTCLPWAHVGNSGRMEINLSKASNLPSFNLQDNIGNNFGAYVLENSEPNYFIVPYLSKRKTTQYIETTNEAETLKISNNFSNLSAKLSRIKDPSFPWHKKYKESCEKILGFMVTSITSPNGQLPWIYFPDSSSLNLSQMGEGVANIIWLLVELAIAKDKLFLIEELENDLHPEALKALLEFIIESSEYNQFIISTHSNIVVNYLSSNDSSNLFNIDFKKWILPTKSTIELVENTTEAKLEVLKELGYSFSDFDLWEWWLILEEASAERIIRDFLIPWFTPKLSRIRTLSAGWIDSIEPVFEDFNRLVRFTHLESIYKNSAWVRTDGDSIGKTTIDKLKAKYIDWKSDRFKTFSKSQFEEYYPEIFQDEVHRVLGISDKKAKRTAKKELLTEVMKWLDEDEKRGREALETSADEIINELREIEKELFE